MHPYRLILSAGASCLFSALVHAKTGTTEPVGYNAYALLASSDTRVSVPLNRRAVFEGQVSSASSNTIVTSGNPNWTFNAYAYASGQQANTYYVRFQSGLRTGAYFTITGNGANSLTLDLADDSLAGVSSGDSFLLIPYWTLGTLFPLADSGVSFTPTISPVAVKTQIFLLDPTPPGINISATAVFRHRNGAWRKVGEALTTSYDDVILFPDSHFIVRNSTEPGTLTVVGDVQVTAIAIPLVVRSDTKQDNIIGLSRPISVSLIGSNLISSGAFRPSLSVGLRTDELLIFDNTFQAINKAASETFFFYNGAWRKFGQDLSIDAGGTEAFSTEKITIIRKGTGSQGNHVWMNQPTY